MKKQFVCAKCGKVNQFEKGDMKRFVRMLTEVHRGEGQNLAYIVKCKHCQADNGIDIIKNERF